SPGPPPSPDQPHAAVLPPPQHSKPSFPICRTPEPPSPPPPPLGRSPPVEKTLPPEDSPPLPQNTATRDTPPNANPLAIAPSTAAPARPLSADPACSRAGFRERSPHAPRPRAHVPQVPPRSGSPHAHSRSAATPHRAPTRTPRSFFLKRRCVLAAPGAF